MEIIAFSASFFLSINVETNVVIIICGSRDFFMKQSSFIFWFGLKYRHKENFKAVFENFQNPCFAHDSLNRTSDMNTRWQIETI